MRTVSVIPASREPATGQSLGRLAPKCRVAGYARVSTDSDDQVSSHSAQVDYYTAMIKAKPEWEFVKIYTDEGISGTSTTRREGFKEMLNDALAGRIDLIVTKSVSRFARNTVDSLTTIRRLKEHKVEVYFEKENIWTFDSKGELLITIMSSLAQEESRSISENTKWGRRKRFADGQVSVPFSRFLGYDRGPDGNLAVNASQALIVRHIFTLFLQGMNPFSIARRLESEGHRTVTGRSEWDSTTISRMLRNEKYKGDALLQKSHTPDFLTKRLVENRGEVPQYYVRGNHEAIIAPDVFDLVQQEIAYRRKHVETTRGASAFRGRIRCGICGGDFGPKVWHSNSRYRKVVWQCSGKYAAKEKPCVAPNLSEDELKAMFVRAVNKLIIDKDAVIRGFEEIKDTVLNTSGDEAALEALKRERVDIVNRMEQLTAENASRAMDQKAYTARFGQLSDRYAKVNEEMAALDEAIRDRRYRRTRTELFLKTLRKQDGLVTGFSEDLWHSLADHATVHSKEDVRFMFRNGMEIKA
ncbi:MAG: recombinase family protein [Spirochaetae bacterium HGW-Spirochaetae-8]|nr:MAG: recombinase family protein [Spirochaetae bacterium HGW-Spirochaetae-8]